MQKKTLYNLDFLMTYGWIILVVLAAVSALAYLVFVGGDSYKTCDLPADVSCSIISSSSSDFLVEITNKAGFGMEDVKLYVNSSSDDFVCSSRDGVSEIADGASMRFICRIESMPVEAFKGILTVEYLNAQTGSVNSKSGEISFRN